MTTLPQLTHDQLDGDQAATWDAIVTSPRGTAVIGPDGALIGPFNIMLHRPGPGEAAARVGEQLRFHATLDPRLLELAVATVAAHWKAEFEWEAHARFAKAAGVDDAVLADLAAGRTPTFVKEDERVVHRYAHELVTQGRPSPEADNAARALVGESGLVELALLGGYYTLVSFLLNAFEVPPPAGTDPTWP
jgi:4-carboxymuconolactone decarboxylase